MFTARRFPIPSMALQTYPASSSSVTMGLRLTHRSGFLEFPWHNGIALQAPTMEQNFLAWLNEKPRSSFEIDFVLLLVVLPQLD
jgi:hypothetical protein